MLKSIISFTNSAGKSQLKLQVTDFYLLTFSTNGLTFKFIVFSIECVSS